MKYLPIPKAEIYPIDGKEGWYKIGNGDVIHFFEINGERHEEPVDDFPFYKLPEDFAKLNKNQHLK